ncbi:HAD hydrolase-like protein [Streptomyces sp. NBC_00083]|nr:HAD hydrolase-like protein [Streptomyces sp. NBC_00083]
MCARVRSWRRRRACARRGVFGRAGAVAARVGLAVGADHGTAPCGPGRLVQGRGVSESVGHKRPDPRIFRAPAATAGASLDGAWVIGDSPHADIAGAHTLGLRSVWVAHGHAWAEANFRLTHAADDGATAIDHAVTASR